VSLFQLRAEHIRALEDAAREDFEDRGVRHLRAFLPAEAAPYSDDQLRERVRACVARAKAYGLHSEQQVMSFVDATYLAGEHFDTSPGGERARLFLDAAGLDPDAKALLMLHSIPRQGSGREADAQAGPGSGGG
jgi:hypothetical protein